MAQNQRALLAYLIARYEDVFRTLQGLSYTHYTLCAYTRDYGDGAKVCARWQHEAAVLSLVDRHLRGVERIGST